MIPAPLSTWKSVTSEATQAYPRAMSSRVVVDPETMQGLPRIAGTRVTVSAILGQLAAGESIEDILDGYPQLERQDVLAALGYAAASTCTRDLALPAAG